MISSPHQLLFRR